MGEQSGRDQSRTVAVGSQGFKTSCTGVTLWHLLAAPRPILVSVLFCRLIFAAARTLFVCCSFLVVLGWPEPESESESEVRMPKRQPCCKAWTGTKCSKSWTISEKQALLLCTEFDDLIHLHQPVVRIRSHVLPVIQTFYSRKLLKFACPIHCWASHGSSSNRLPVQHSTYPAFRWKAHNVASKFPLLRCAGFSPRFYVAYLNHFSHTLIPNMQNFVPCQQIPAGAPTTHRIMRRKWISNLSISAAWMHRGPAPKQAIGVTMASKSFSLFLMDTFRLRNIDLLAKKARFADCKW